ncbi:MAG: hypothetical protein V4737_10980, partial [Curtobacterium sp.]
MSEPQPPRPTLAERARHAVTAFRGSVARRPVPWIAGGLAGVLVLGSGGAVAVAAATMPELAAPTRTTAAAPTATASRTPSAKPSATPTAT